MSSPFTLTKLENRYSITWHPSYEMRGNSECFNLLKILFNQIKLNEVTLLLNDNQTVTMQDTLWYANRGEKYSEWLMSQYNITGVVFKKKSEAEELQIELEKRFMWKLLKL